MKNTNSLIVSVSDMKDIKKITKDTKYINIDITNPNYDIIKYFIDKGSSFMYTDMIDDHSGYNYANYEAFKKAETIIDMIYVNMPNNLTKLEMAKYLYVAIAKCISFDINTDNNKSELYNLSLISSVNNLWSSLANGITTDISASKLYYYLCRRMDININIIIDENQKSSLTKLKINNQILVTDLYEDIPYIQASMQTKYFATYNDDIYLDKKIKYIKGKYNDYYIDKALKNIDYTKEDCVWLILSKTEDIINVNNLKPITLSIIYKYIFDKYCPNYNIKINNLYLNNIDKKHFIIISYNNLHYSYNYKYKRFVKVSEESILNSLTLGKIRLYQNEIIPNINNSSEFINQIC